MTLRICIHNLISFYLEIIRWLQQAVVVVHAFNRKSSWNSCFINNILPCTHKKSLNMSRHWEKAINRNFCLFWLFWFGFASIYWWDWEESMFLSIFRTEYIAEQKRTPLLISPIAMWFQTSNIQWLTKLSEHQNLPHFSFSGIFMQIK